MTENALIGPSS